MRYCTLSFDGYYAAQLRDAAISIVIYYTRYNTSQLRFVNNAVKYLVKTYHREHFLSELLVIYTQSFLTYRPYQNAKKSLDADVL